MSLLAFFFVFTVFPALAAEWPPIAAEDMALSSVPQQPGAPAIVLYREETDDDTLHSQTIYTRIKVLTEAGRHCADVEIPYNRRGFTIPQVSGRTVHPDGSVIPFQGKPFDKIITRGHNIRHQVKSFTLPDVQVGSILDYRYSLFYSDQSLVPPAWTIQDDLFQKRVMLKYIPYKTRSNTYVTVERDRIATGVAWSDYLPTAGNQPKLESSADGKEWVDMEMDNVPAFVEEPYSLPANTLKYRVNFYYRVELKQDEYWKNEGKYWSKQAENFMGRRKGIPEAVAQTVAAGDAPDLKVRKLYALVSKLENRSYLPARTLQEVESLGIKPNEGVEDVLRQRSGGHDEVNRLFVAMVREAGIPAWLMRVPDREYEIFMPEFLSANQFDAEIAIVQLDGKDVFLDPGTRFCPYPMLPWHYSGLQGLRQSATKGTEIAVAAVPTYKQAMIERMAQLQLTEHGTVEGTITVGFLGLEALERRREGGRTDAEGRKKLLEEEVRSWLPGGTELTLTNAPDWENSGALVAEFKVSSPLATSAGKHWVVPVHVFQVNQKPLFASAQRVNPIYFDYPSQEVDQIHITLPPGMDVESLPPDDKVHLDYALYETQQKRQPSGEIVSVRNLIMGGMAFPVAQYKELKGFYDKVKTGDDQPVILKASAHAAATGN